jgi:hypothetical protein
MNGLSDHEVERKLGYTPCVCGVLDGTWHPQCYTGKTQAQIKAGYKSAFLKARAYLKSMAAVKTAAVIDRAARKP